MHLQFNRRQWYTFTRLLFWNVENWWVIEVKYSVTLHDRMNQLRWLSHQTFVVCTNKQESPPAWTQEAYRPPCSKYSLCCPNWVPPPARVPPRAGYPLARVPPLAGYLPWPGYPPGQGTPPTGCPPLAGPGRVPPPAAPWHSGKCCKALWDTGTPPPQMWTDWKHYLPPSFGCGR